MSVAKVVVASARITVWGLEPTKATTTGEIMSRERMHVGDFDGGGLAN